MPEYTVQLMADTDTVIPIAGVHQGRRLRHVATFLPARSRPTTRSRALQWHAVQRLDPVLYYNRADLRGGRPRSRRPAGSARGAPGRPAQQIVDCGAATYGLALDNGFDCGGGWFLEQWFAKAGELYANNENGRAAPATRCCSTAPTGVELLTPVQSMVDRRAGRRRRRQRRAARTTCSSWSTARRRRP